MNNEQFRRLVNSNFSNQKSWRNAPIPKCESHPPLSALASRPKSSVSTTRRSGTGAAHLNFARQLAERKQADNAKKLRSLGPKDTAKSGTSHIDRSEHGINKEEDEKVLELKSLDESFKNKEINCETYEKRRDEIAGGDLSSTHLVKGLDFKLLERIRRGEDINLPKTNSKEGIHAHDSGILDENQAGRDESDDADFDKIAEREVNPILKDKTVKKGHMAPTTLVPGRKRTRNEILAEMKAARAAADKKKEEHSLGWGFKKIGQTKKAGSRIERDSKGREILIIVDEDGHERRKVRKVAPDDAETRERERLAMIPDKNAKPLGMEVPDVLKKTDLQPDEDENDDIFNNAGDDYDPLAGLDEESDSDEDNKDTKNEVQEHHPEMDDYKSLPSLALPQQPSAPRDYFVDSKTKLLSQEQTKAPPLSDPSIRAALRKAATLAHTGEREDQENVDTKSRAERLREMLANQDRDAEDMDLGFGTSRFEDEDDIEAEEKGIRLSKWGDEGGEDSVQGGGRKQKRKRGPKKRKGDKDSVADVMKVLKGRRVKG